MLDIVIYWFCFFYAFLNINPKQQSTIFRKYAKSFSKLVQYFNIMNCQIITVKDPLQNASFHDYSKDILTYQAPGLLVFQNEGFNLSIMGGFWLSVVKCRLLNFNDVCSYHLSMNLLNNIEPFAYKIDESILDINVN